MESLTRLRFGAVFTHTVSLKFKSLYQDAYHKERIDLHYGDLIDQNSIDYYDSPVDRTGAYAYSENLIYDNKTSYQKYDDALSVFKQDRLKARQDRLYVYKDLETLIEK